MSKDQMFAKVVLASCGAESPPLYTLHLHYPRMLLPEFNTHRAISKNTRSSRAVPSATMLEEVQTNPFIPWHWGKNQKGMQADEECVARVMAAWSPTSGYDHDNEKYGGTSNKRAWLHARYMALNHAQAFANAGYHKQVVNRLLEPFAWTDTLATATDWKNFLWLRDHKDAEPHMRDLAQMVREAIDGTEIQQLKPGQWHLPYITEKEKSRDILEWIFTDTIEAVKWEEVACKLSAARCARISYKPFDGNASYERELQRYDSLVSSDRIHASPLEHQATPDVPNGFHGWRNSGAHGNLTGWIQFRKTVPGESVPG